MAALEGPQKELQHVGIGRNEKKLVGTKRTADLVWLPKFVLPMKGPD
jgi:hypothetical protein